MTETPVQVRATARATARVGAHAPKPSGAAALRPRRRPGHLGPVHILQLILAEIVIIAILVSLKHSMIVLIPAILLGLALLGVTLSRRHGRWWAERGLMTWQFRRRRTAAPAGTADDPRLAAMRWLAPGLTVEDVPSPDGSLIAVARDDAGWFAAAALPTSTAMRDDPRPPLPLDILVSALVEADRSAGAVLQVVTHTVPAPARDGASGQSYRELLQRYGSIAVPVERVTWFAVRLDIRILAEMGPEQLEQAPQMVSALLRHLTKVLRRKGISSRALDRDALLDALDRSCDLIGPEAETPQRPQEDWDVWHSGRMDHRTFWVQEWPAGSHTGILLDGLAGAPADLTSVALILAPDGDDVDIRCLARVAAAPNRLAAVCQAVEACALAARARLFRLDGEQGPATYATAPTGGGPR